VAERLSVRRAGVGAWRPVCSWRARNRRNDMSRILMGVGMLGALTMAAGAQPNEPTKVTAGTPAAPPAPTQKPRPVLAKNGDGVPGAIISAGEASALADGDGNFEIDTSTTRLHVVAEGYAERDIDVTGDHAVVQMDVEVPGEEIIVTGTRLPEKRLDA